MASHEFLSAVKSTLDHEGNQVATNLPGGVAFVDLDDTVNVDAVLSSDDPAIVWQFMVMDEAPADPLYTVQFAIGAKTTQDPANYKLIDFVTEVHKIFAQGHTIKVMDWTGASVPTIDLGYLYVQRVSLAPQEFDAQSGMRLWVVDFRAVRYGQ